MQEIKGGQVVYAQDVVVCDAFHDQRNPRIDILTESPDISYLIYWEDMRSSGKEYFSNLFSQQLRINDCNGNLGGNSLCQGASGDIDDLGTAPTVVNFQGGSTTNITENKNVQYSATDVNATIYAHLQGMIP